MHLIAHAFNTTIQIWHHGYWEIHAHNDTCMSDYHQLTHHTSTRLDLTTNHSPTRHVYYPINQSEIDKRFRLKWISHDDLSKRGKGVEFSQNSSFNVPPKEWDFQNYDLGHYTICEQMESSYIQALTSTYVGSISI